MHPKASEARKVPALDLFLLALRIFLVFAFFSAFLVVLRTGLLVLRATIAVARDQHP